MIIIWMHRTNTWFRATPIIIFKMTYHFESFHCIVLLQFSIVVVVVVVVAVVMLFILSIVGFLHGRQQDYFLHFSDIII